MPASHRFRLAILAPLAAALIALGCVSAPRAPSDEPRPTRATSTGTAGSDGRNQPEGTDTPQEFAQDIDGARQVADAYWAKQFDAAGLNFRPIRRVIPYDRDGEVDCGGQPLGRNNAAYCSAGDFIAYDVNWAFAAFRQIGDAFIYYLLGHEYSHGIQLRLGIQKQYTIQQELQADCMAGAYIGDSVRDGQLALQDGDLDELARGLEAVGDDPGQPWFAEGAHGTAEQRTQAFRSGLEESLRPCNVW
ncbi:MAG TPA: neutral zinc metallopeptidase [Actinoplanes sp.]|nr:neutral zinc metallopeptidase [Actinoplanes sp.]